MIDGRLFRAMAAAMLLASSSVALGQGDAQKLFFDGYELLNAGKPADAIAKFETGLRIDPNNALAHFYYGEASFALGRLDAAKAALRRCLELDPESQVATDARKRLAELTGNVFAKPNADAESIAGSSPSAGTVLRDCPVCPEMVVVPAGEFIMGSPVAEPGRELDEGPPRLVTFAAPFALGKYEVTHDEWEACVREKGCGMAEDAGWGRGKRPVIKVTYDQAIGYAEWLSEKTGKRYRLPTEAEWEYAARAGSRKARYWGATATRACEFANVGNASTTALDWWKPEWQVHACEDGYQASTAPVGSYKPNAYGLHDMLGNVWEWVEDCYTKNYLDAPTSGSAIATPDCGTRVLRGGGWYDGPAAVRSGKRFGFRPTGRFNTVGFRVARTLP